MRAQAACALLAAHRVVHGAAGTCLNWCPMAQVLANLGVCMAAVDAAVARLHECMHVLATHASDCAALSPRFPYSQSACPTCGGMALRATTTSW